MKEILQFIGIWTIMLCIGLAYAEGQMSNWGMC